MEQVRLRITSLSCKTRRILSEWMRPAKYCGQRIRINDTICVPIGIQEMGSGKWRNDLDACWLKITRPLGFDWIDSRKQSSLQSEA